MNQMKTPKHLVKSILLRSGTLRLLSLGVRRRVALLRYHSVLDEEHRLAKSIGPGIIHSPATFEAQMELVSRRYVPVTLDDVLQFLRGEIRLAAGSVAITFDDGFADNYEIAAPILERFGLKATFYVTVGSVEGPPPWFCRLNRVFQETSKRAWADPFAERSWDLSDSAPRREAFLSAVRSCGKMAGSQQDDAVSSIEKALDVRPLLPEDRVMMDWRQIKALHEAGHIIGSHTMTHPNLAHIDVDEMRYEIEESKRVLEKQLGSPVVHFSYPAPILRPHWTETTCSHAEQAGYQTGVTAVSGPVKFGDSPHSLARVPIPREIDAFRWALESSFVGYRV